ncbi:MAG: tetratricopeptide repeat protein [Euryarchaeota archaeon]|nr:tetratricopeptide repeat protein [Euryarchaeota archaeon]MDE1878968.1 tetratricopeptide repeat protein [Euryarchaeota archaeon]
MNEDAPPGSGGPPHAVAFPSELLEELDRGRGSLLLLHGGTEVSRGRELDDLANAARRRGLEAEILVADPFEQEVPFGALLPWLSRLLPSHHHVSGRDAPAEAWLPLVALSGLLATEGARQATLDLSPAASAVPEPSHEGAENGPTGARGSERPGPPPDLEAEWQFVPPEDLRAVLLELVEGRARKGPTVVCVRHAEHLDLAGREWFQQLARGLERLPLLVSLSFDTEGPELAGWRGVGPSAGPCEQTLPPDPGRSPSSSPGPHPTPPRALSAEDGRLLGAVALAGPDAHPVALSQALGTPPDRTEAGLSHLAAQGWIEREGGVWRLSSPDRRAEVLKELGPATVAQLHRGLAAMLEKLHPVPRGKVLFRLGDHWAEAGGVESGFPRLLASAVECERWGAPVMAETRLRRALLLAQGEAGARGRELEEIAYSRISAVRYRSSDPSGALEAVRRALALARGRGTSVHQWALYVARAGMAQVDLGEDPEAELTATLEKVRGQFPEVEAELLRVRAVNRFSHGRSGEAIDDAERACALLEGSPNAAARVRVQIAAAGTCLFSGGDPEKAREHLLQALDLRGGVEGGPDQGLIVAVLDQLSQVEFNLGRYAPALARGEEAIREARRLGTRQGLADALGNTAEAACAAGDPARAAALAEELRGLCSRYRIPEPDASHLQLLLVEGLVAEAGGDPKEALVRFERLVAVAEKAGKLNYLGQALIQKALLLERTGDRNGARALIGRLHRGGLVRNLPADNRKKLAGLEARLAPAASEGSTRQR